MIYNLTSDDRICSSCRRKLTPLLVEGSAPKPTETLPMEVVDNEDENQMSVDNSDTYDENGLIDDFLKSENPETLTNTLPSSLIVTCVKFFYSIVNTVNSVLLIKVSLIDLIMLFLLTMSSVGVKKYLYVSEYCINKSKNLLETKGLFSIRDPKKGKELPQDLTDYVVGFHLRDDISSARPGMRVVIKQKQEDGTTIEIKRRLMHWNLREAYELLKLELQKIQKFQNYHIGFTKFTLLRPKHVLLVGASGTHNVCVFAIHQNVNLMIQGAHLSSLTKNENIHIDSYRKCYPLLICENATEDCYFLKCNKCPGKENLIDYLKEVFEKNEVETVSAKQWKTDNNKTALETLQYDYDEFIDCFAERLENLLGHAYIADQQSKYSRNIENNLKDSEFKVVCDFAENYSYVVQDAIQGFHWNNDQATIYNVVIYYRQNKQIYHRSVVIVSENRKHDAVSVYTFNKAIVNYLKKEFSYIKKIYYFSDGAPQQYKNYKHVINVASHKQDFEIEAEWHYYPTSHGKGPCDGLGASVKHGTRSYCLQSKGENQILNCDDLFKWLSTTDRFAKVTFIYSLTADYNKNERFLNSRFKNTKRIDHLQEQHCLIPSDNGSIRVKRFSRSTSFVDTKIS